MTQACLTQHLQWPAEGCDHSISPRTEVKDLARHSGTPNNIHSKDDEVARIVDADALVSRPDMTLAEKVRRLVRETLPLGCCSVEEVAQHLGVDRRTVHRHLGRSGETFSSLLDEVRAELVEGYLEGNKVEGNKGRLTDVADLLGFSAPSAFSRWHKRHFGFTLTDRRTGKQPAGAGA
jgi:AraC-like DNA-binding protein